MRGGTLTYLDSGRPPSLDPVAHPGVPNGAYEAIAVYDVLVYEATGTGKLTYQLATSLDSKDDVTWDLKLRPNVKFSDGTPLDAEAVKFNWARIADPANTSQHAPAAQSIASMKIVDALTLRVTLKRPNAQFARVVANELPFIGSPTAIEKHGKRFGQTAESTVGAGAFLLKEWVPGDHQRFVRNPKYWDAPRPYLDELVLRGIVDADQRYNTLATGAAQMLGVEAAYTLVSKAEGDDLASARAPASGALGLQLNTKRAPFDDLTARRALAAAIDRQGLVDTALDGAVAPFENLFDERSPFYDADVQWPGYDPEEAQRLIDEYAASHGGPLEFTFYFPNFFSTYGEALQTQLSQFENLKVDIELVSYDAFLPKLAGGDFQATIDAPGFVDPEPNLANRYATDGANNFGGYSNPDMDEALRIGRESQDQGERHEAYSTVQTLAIEDQPYVWLAPFVYLQLHTAAVRGIDWAVWGVTLFDRIWLEQ